MKRTLSLILCAAMLLASVAAFSGCTTLVKLSDGTYDKGAVIDMYIGAEVYDFDPALSFTDNDMVKVLSLLFEGLTRLKDNGKWEKALMKSYDVTTDKMNGDTLLTITLKETCWSDGRTVQAADIMYAWKRILDPEFKNEAAAMLYDIKNAKEVKSGDCSIDDVGITCPGTYVLEIRFDKNREVDIDRFFETVASVALVPLREDVVSKSDFWAKKMTTLISNGPFCVKQMDFGSLLRLERNSCYYLDQDEDSKEYLDKYVVPYRLVTHYDVGTLEDQLAAYKAGLLYYLGDIPVDARGEYKDEATITDEMNTLSCYFNVENSILADARVRQALSMAIDRKDLASKLVYADAADALITDGVFNTTRKNSFREEGGSLLSTSADVAGAKALLDAAKKDGALARGTVTLTVRATAHDTENTNDHLFTATYLAAVWNELLADYGIKVEVRKLNISQVIVGGVVQLYYTDDFQVAYKNGDFDIMLSDVAMLSTDAYATLAPYAVAYSGNGIDMNSPTYDAYTHVTGYNSEAYNALIEQIYGEADAAKRAELLHKAEKMLLTDMPVTPLVFTKDAYLVNDKVVKKVDSTYTGARYFNDTRMKDYMEYKTNYDYQPMQVYSGLLVVMGNQNDYIREYGCGFYWQPYLDLSGISLYMTMDELAEYISSIHQTGTKKEAVVPMVVSLICDQYKLETFDIDGSATMYDLVKMVCDKIA